MDGSFSHEELIDLFTRSLSLAVQNPSAPEHQFVFGPESSKTPTYTSQHYTHSIHHTSAPDATETTLRAHSINPSYLFPCQLTLFRTADSSQRLRLLELWRTAPFRAGDMDAIRYRYGELTATNLIQEEIMARLRHERDVAEQNVVAIQKGEAEPYMVSGYEGTEERPGLWDKKQPEREMEDQYGAWMAARDFERIQEIHRQVENRPTTGMDEEMTI